MKTNLKHNLLKVLSFVFAISAFALVANLSYNTAKADEEPVAIFAVDNTSSARIGNDGYYGIKFTATVNDVWVAEQEAESIEYGILVYEKANAIDVSEKTLEEVVEATSAVNYTYPAAVVEGSYTFAGTQVCNSTDTDELNKFLATEYEAKAYAIVDGELVWAEGAYASSARKTAALSVVADIDNEEIYNKYYSLLGDVDTVVAKGDGKLFDLAVEDGAYSFMAPDKSMYNVSVKDGKVALDVEALANAEVGSSFKGFLFADGNDAEIIDNELYKVEFMVADVVISTPAELQGAFDPTAENNKYYALANDIDLEGYDYVGPTGVMSGVFNGRGFTIKNFKWRRGLSNTLFGKMDENGVLKNVAITDFWDGGDYWGIAIIAERCANCTVENVYIRPRPGINGFNALGLYDSNKTTLTNIVFDYQPIDQELKADGTLGLANSKNTIQVGNYQGLIATLRAKCDNVYMVTPYISGAYAFAKYSSTHVTDDTALEYELYFAENDTEMPYFDTIKNPDGSLTHQRVGYPEDIVTVLNNYNANLPEGEEAYVYQMYDATKKKEFDVYCPDSCLVKIHGEIVED